MLAVGIPAGCVLVMQYREIRLKIADSLNFKFNYQAPIILEFANRKQIKQKLEINLNHAVTFVDNIFQTIRELISVFDA